MAAYLVLMQQVDDTERYRGEYVPAVMPFLEKHGGVVLTGGFEAQAASLNTAPTAYTTPRAISMADRIT